MIDEISLHSAIIEIKVFAIPHSCQHPAFTNMWKWYFIVLISISLIMNKIGIYPLINPKCAFIMLYLYTQRYTHRNTFSLWTTYSDALLFLFLVFIYSWFVRIYTYIWNYYIFIIYVHIFSTLSFEFFYFVYSIIIILKFIHLKKRKQPNLSTFCFITSGFNLRASPLQNYFLNYWYFLLTLLLLNPLSINVLIIWNLFRCKTWGKALDTYCSQISSCPNIIYYLI